jgi:hypothetical protein
MQPVSVIDRAPETRCHECGSTKIHSLCHHCAKPMCAEHSPQAFRPTGAAQGAGHSTRPTSQEFAWLKQSDLHRAAVYHCPEHAHSVGDGLLTLTVAGIALAVLGLATLLFAPVLGIAVLLIGVGIAAAGVVQRARKGPPDPASLLPLPVFPHVNSAEVVERLDGSVSFARGRYMSTMNGPVTGEIRIDMSANDGQEWLSEYRKKYHLAASEPVRFTAGFAMIRGRAGLRFRPGQGVVLPTETGLRLGGDSAGGHELFNHVPGRRPGEWILSAHYEVPGSVAADGVPLWIVPSIVPSSDRRTLEVDLHWNRLGPDGKELTLTRFESIELEVPAAWGALQSSSPAGPTIDSSRRGVRVIRWAGIPPTEGGGQQKQAAHGDRAQAAARGSGSRVLELHFERAVVSVPEPGDDAAWDQAAADVPRFKGRLKAIFEKNAPADGRSAIGTLSGVNGIDLYLPGGGRTRQQPKVRVRTEVTVTFDISLDAVRYQDDWVVPANSNAWDSAVAANQQNPNAGVDTKHEPRNKDDVFVGVIPDYRTVGELTNAISEKGYYVKSVVEHPPYRDDDRRNMVNRVWDIAGRWYHGVFPIDFHVYLRGEEVRGNGVGAFSSRTVAQVTVKGTYINDRELTQRTMIEAKWDDLYGEVTGLLRRRSVGDNGTPALAAVGANSGWEDAAPNATRWDNDAREDRIEQDSYDENVVEAEIVDAVIIESQRVGTGGRRADLRRKRDAADDALLAGRISEDTHRGITMRIQIELSELGEQS